MVEIKYNNSTIATVEGGQVATLACNGKEMESDLEIIASQVANSPLPIEVTIEAEMTALLEAPVIGGIYKYTGTTGAYENGAIYVIEKAKEEVVNLISFAIESAAYQAEEGMTWGEWVTSNYNTDNYGANSDGSISPDGIALGGWVAYSNSHVNSVDKIVNDRAYYLAPYSSGGSND